MRSLALILIGSLALACAGNDAPTANPTKAPATASFPIPTTAPPSAPTDAPATDAPTEPATTAPTGPTDPPAATVPPAEAYTFQEFDLPGGSGPHDVAPHPDGSVWYTGQRNGTAGRLDPATGEVTEVDLGPGAAPHGVIVADDGGIWITDQGLNALLQIDPATLEVETFPMPGEADAINAGPHTPAIDLDGRIWFTGANGYIGVVDPRSDDVGVWSAPGGSGPYGIDVAPDGFPWFVSLQGHYLARVHPASGEIEVFEPPTPNQGARRVWSDSRGRLWVSEWDAEQLAMYDPPSGEWREWRLPGDSPLPYSVYVDELDLVWLTDFSSNALVRFDPQTETFDSFTIPTAGANVRQQLGRPGELWGAESGNDKLVVLRY